MTEDEYIKKLQELIHTSDEMKEHGIKFIMAYRNNHEQDANVAMYLLWASINKYINLKNEIQILLEK